jgi:D-alanyl-D-alanine carboxypeptidase
MRYDYLDELLRSVPMDPQMPGRRYGAGVAIDESGVLGTVYGHAGWVPGYVSFVRYLADERIAVAFQTNTDAGLLDGDESAIADIEARLTRVVTGRP